MSTNLIVYCFVDIGDDEIHMSVKGPHISDKIAMHTIEI